MILERVEDFVWEMPKQGKMRVPARLYIDEEMAAELEREEKTEWSTLRQLKNIAALPGIQGKALALADCHPGYGAPIGGIAAMDLDEGVITFGSIGFDINCLDGNTRVLHEFGYTKKIKDFEGGWKGERIKCSNPTERIKNTGIENFLAFKPKETVYRVKTESGREIIATADHPFLTPNGMVELKRLNNEKIAIYPFEGNEYEEPGDEVIVSRKDIEALQFKKNMKQSIDELEKRGLLPLRMDSEKFPYLIKLFGYALRNGDLFFTKQERAQIWFYGEKEGLEEIQKDFEILGLKASRIYSRAREHSIKNMYGSVEFKNTELSVKSGSNGFAALLVAMGLPAGNKTAQNWILPSWLFKCPKWQKRLFLASFFGAGLTLPKTMTGYGYNFYNQIISINKKKGFVGSGRKFLEQLAKLLKEFGVKSSQIKEKEDYKNRKGEVSIRLRLQINNTNENLQNLWKKISFEYNKKRAFLANVAVQYIRLKEKVLEERRNAEQKAKKLKESGKTLKEITKALQTKNVNMRFLERSIWGGRKTSPRLPLVFPKFEKFQKEATKGLGKTGQVWEKIISKERIPFNKKVYDFTVKDENHNFIANNFVVSNCGVRTLATELKKEDIEKKKKKLAEELFRHIPAGLGVKGELKLNESEIDEVLAKGAEYVVEKGYGYREDLEFTEMNGKVFGAIAENVSRKAKQRQFKQVGTLGSGNHYLEVQFVEKILEEESAEAFGLFEGQILVSIHCGSRALGHQIGMDYLTELMRASEKYEISLPDKELVSAPIASEEGQKYLSAVNSGMNCAFANRQVLAHLARESFSRVLGVEERKIRTFYDVGHNTAKIEEHVVEGKKKKLLVHRKGSTRAFGPNRKEVPKQYRKAGQPVLVGGTMGTASYILRGTEKGMLETFGSGVHGAGRKMSRHAATRQFDGKAIAGELAARGIIVKTHSWKGAAEEAPLAYKDIDSVVRVMNETGVNRAVARLKPLITIKG